MGVEWVTAIATSLAVIVALGVAVSEPWRQRRREERAQAQAVHVWTRLDQKRTDIGLTAQGWHALAFNGSTRPVFDLEAMFRITYDDQSQQTIGFVFGDVLLPTPTEAVTWWPSTSMRQVVDETGHPREVIDLAVVSFTFTDADSRTWIDKSGTLHRTK